jgi:hypothetical protein
MRIRDEVTEKVNYRLLLKLRAAYKHPWLKKRDEIFEYYNQKLKADPRLRGSRYTDLNITDSADFTSLKNLARGSLDRARRAKSKFLSE